MLLVFGASSAQAITVNLCTFPEGGSVPNGTVLSDQWRSIGILFDANPISVNPVKREWGPPTCSLFFNPDIYGVTAVFNFVVPGTTEPTNTTNFSLHPWFNPGESAELVGLDGSSNVVAQDTVTPADIGDSSKNIRMSIFGDFHSVEWRTHGDPGIAANEIEFGVETTGSTPQKIPTSSKWAVILLVMLLAGVGFMYVRRQS
jgi:hypothetical protein